MIPQLGLVGAAAEDGENDFNTDCEIGWYKRRVGYFDGLVGGEVLELFGGDIVEGVACLDLVGDVGVGEVGVAGAGDGDEEALVWRERGRRGGDVAGFGDGESAEVEEVAYGCEVEKFWSRGSVEDVGLAGEDGGLVGGAAVACDGALGMRLMEEEKRKEEEKEKWVSEEGEMGYLHLLGSAGLGSLEL